MAQKITPLVENRAIAPVCNPISTGSGTGATLPGLKPHPLAPVVLRTGAKGPPRGLPHAPPPEYL
jgi:hypothetical protein